MNSGLYDRDGVSATARQAAFANWFDGPTRKESKVYRGMRLPGRGPTVGELSVTSGSASCSTDRAAGPEVFTGTKADGRASSAVAPVASGTNTSFASPRPTSRNASDRTTE